MQTDLLTLANEQLTRRGGEVVATLEPAKRGTMLRLTVDKQYSVAKFYGTGVVDTYSPQLIRVQVDHLYDQLIQQVLDRNVGLGALYVK